MDQKLSPLSGGLVLALFYLAHNFGTFFYQVRGVPEDQVQVGFIGYFLGIMAGGLFMGQVDRLMRSGRQPLGRSVLVVVLLVPALLCQIPSTMAGYTGTSFLNFIQPFFWAIHLPVAFHFFSRTVPIPLQAPAYGIVLGIGYVGWALLMPFLTLSYDLSAFPALDISLPENRFLPLLNSSRNLIGAAFALVCGYFLTSHHAMLTAAEETPVVSHLSRGCHKQMWLLIMPFLACFFFNSFIGFLFFSRIFVRAPYPEYMYFMLMVACPLIGLLLHQRGDRVLRRLVWGSVLVHGTLPLLLYVNMPQAVEFAVYMACTVCQQLLLFSGILIFLRFAPWSAYPGLTASLPCLACGAAIVSSILTRGLFMAVSLPPFVAAFSLCLACLLSLIPFTKAFPLPQPQTGVAPVSPGFPVSMVAPGDPPLLPPDATAEVSVPSPLAPVMAFAQAFKLTGRETQILEGLVRGLQPAAIGQELGISESTVRYHQTGLFRKTNQPDRRRFMLFYAQWIASQS